MASFAVKGVRIGEGRPKTVVSLMGATTDELVNQATRAVAAGADCVEWRADFARNVGDPQAMALAARELSAVLVATPLLFTFRSKEQGGQLPLEPLAYEKLNRAVLETGAIDLVDVELGAGQDVVRALVEAAHGCGARAVASHHDFGGTPTMAAMTQLLEQMAGLGADVAKLAVFAHDVRDCLRLMDATEQARQKLDVVLLTIAMGQAGALSRLCGQAVGSALTFCSLGTPSAPGQVSLAQATRVLDELDAVLAANDHSA